MSLFFDRLVTRLDKIDPASLQKHMQSLVSESRTLETILDSLQEGVVVLDDEGLLNYANPAAERLLGFRAEALRGHPVARYFGDLDWGPLTDIDWSAAPGEGGEWSHLLSREIELTYPERRVVSFYAVPLPAREDGGENFVLLILRDITAEREREQSDLEGARTDAVKMLAAGVAHEIGNPLNALNIHLQLLTRELRGLEDEEQRDSLTELVDIARNEVGRLDAIIRQFLQAIRPSKPHLEPYDVGALLHDTLNVLRTDIENRRIEVSVAGADRVPAVLLDPGQIKQVFFNLVKNAMEAMPDGGRLAIAVSAGDAYLRVDFTDSGVGIPAEELGRIFEPYHTTKQKGTGLGLMVVQRIVHDHGGQIEVSSRPGEGTRFRVLLPLAERRVRKLAQPAPDGEGAAK